MQVRTDLLTGLALVAGGGAMFVTALGFPVIPAMAYGPGLFPKIVAVGLIVSGLGIAAEGVAGRSVNDKQPLSPLPIVLLFGVVLAFILLLPHLGFHIAGTLATAAVIAIFGGGWMTILLFAPLATILVHLLFYNLLRVPLPWGLLLPVAW